MYFCISVHARARVCVLAPQWACCMSWPFYYETVEYQLFISHSMNSSLRIQKTNGSGGLSQHARVNHSWMFIKHKHILCLPATLATLSASWLFAPFERLGLRCLPPPVAERMLRRCTSVALKKATMKGCLFWGPLRPTRPAVRGLILSPVGGDREDSATGVQTDQCANEKSWAPEFKKICPCLVWLFLSFYLHVNCSYWNHFRCIWFYTSDFLLWIPLPSPPLK